MNQRIAVITAGALTAAVIASVFAFSLFANPAPTQASSSQQPGTLTDVAAAPNSENSVAEDAQQQQAFQAVAAERELVLKQQVAERQAALTGLDETRMVEIEKLQAELVNLGNEIHFKSLTVEELQAKAQATQQAIEQDNLRYQNELKTLQSTAIATDTALRQELDGTLQQLQLAYNEIAARQSVSSSQNNANNNGHYEDHDDDEHEHEEHDDD